MFFCFFLINVILGVKQIQNCLTFNTDSFMLKFLYQFLTGIYFLCIFMNISRIFNDSIKNKNLYIFLANFTKKNKNW